MAWHLAALCLALLLPVFILAGVLAWSYAASERAQLEQTALEAARHVTVAIDRDLAGLTAAAEMLALSRSLQAGDLDEFDRQARAAQQRLGANVVVRDRAGRQVVNTRLPRGAPLPAEPDFAPDRAVLETGRPYVSDLLVGAVTRAPLFLVNVPVRRSEDVAYFLDLSLPPERIRDLIRQEHPPEGWLVAVVDRQGVRVARSHQHEALVGQPLQRPLWEGATKGEEGIIGNVRRTPEGELVLAAYSHAQLSGWTVVVGVPTARMAAPLRDSLAFLAALAVSLLALSAGLAVLFARRIARPVLALAAEAARLGRGEAARPLATAVCEVDAVGAALATAGAEWRASEGRLRETLATLDLGAFMARHPDGTIRHWSAGCEHLYGWTAVEAAGRNAHQLLRTTFPASPAEIEVALEHEGEWIGELRHRTKDGRELVVTTHQVLRRGLDGRPIAVLEAMADVTTQRRAEAALAESEARFRSTFEQAAVGIAHVALDGTWLRVNCRFCAMLGYTEAELLAQAFQDITHPDDLRVDLGALCRLLAGEIATYSREKRYLRKDGATLWVELTVSLLRDAAGAPRHFISVIQDISARKGAEAALAKSEARLRAATEGAGLGVYELDLARGAVWLDARAATVLAGALPAGAWIPLGGPDYTAFAARIHPEDHAHRDAALATITAGISDGMALEYRVRRADGGWAWIWSQGTPLERDPTSGRPRRLIGIVQDVTEHHRLEAELHQAQKLQVLGQLAGGIAHDINNVLQVVAGSAALIGRGAEDAEAVRRRARMVAEAAERGASITRRLLAFARRSELRAEAMDPAGLLHGLREILAPTLGPRIAVRVETAAGLPPLLADKGQLETALMNLATNARDAMPEGGALTLSAAAEQVQDGAAAHPAGLTPGCYIRLSVRDTGVGMDTTTLARVAEPFFTTKAVGKGTGLGLPMVKGFVEQSGGACAIESAPSRGTTVTLWFPQPGEEAVAPTAAEPLGAIAMGWGGAPRILVVDDEPAVRETLAADLDAAGLAVLVAADGAEALARLDAGAAVDALVTDMTMPGMDGLALIREVRARRPGLPAVLLTGYAGDVAALALSDAEGGPFSLLRKPAFGAQLADCLAVLLETGAA